MKECFANTLFKTSKSKLDLEEIANLKHSV